jgi:hypothetical protein
MPSIPVARQGEVTATAGTTPYTGADSGTWTPGSINSTAHTKLKRGGTSVIRQASCLFSFSGANSSGTAVAGTSTVTLTAGTTKLQKGVSNVLQDGDEASDSYGNKLKAITSGKLKSA